MRVVTVGPPRRHALIGVGVAALLASAGCGSQYHPEYHPVSSYTVNQSVSYPTIFQVGSAGSPANPSVAYSPPPVSNPPRTSSPPGDPSRVLIVESAHLDRPGEVIGVVDVEDATGSHDAGIALLKRRAAEMGADGVVGVEFHKGEDGQPTHVSGLAVRFLRAVRGPTRE